MSEFITGAAELDACGATGPELARCAAADAELTRLARRSRSAAGLGAGLATAVTGLTVWGVLVLGVAAVGMGTLTRVPLAVLTLTALAAFEAVTPPARRRDRARRLRQLRPPDRRDPRRARAGRRPARAAAPAGPGRRPVPAGPSVCACPAAPCSVRSAAAAARPRDGSAALTGLDLDLAPGRRVAIVGPSGAGKSTAAAVLLRFCELSAGSATLNGHDLSATPPTTCAPLIGGCAQDPHIFAASLPPTCALARP